jgi:hypothetical protein
MFLKSILFLLMTSVSFAAKANPLFHLKVQNQVKIQVILEAFEYTLIQDLKDSKKIAACMKIAEANTSAENLGKIYRIDSSLFKDGVSVGVVEMSLRLAYVNCELLDTMRVDKKFLYNISRHLEYARSELPKI